MNNYEITRRETEKRFLKYSQENMISRFSLEHDAEYLYLPFVNVQCRIERSSGRVEMHRADEEVWQEADFNPAMTIYDYLCDSKPYCHASGEFVTIHSLQAVITSRIGGNMFDSMADFIEHNTEAVCRACEAMGGQKAGKGDLSYQFSVFADLQMRLSFWHSDEDFPASLEIFWDKNVLDYIRFETTYYAAGYIMSELRKLASVDNKAI